MVSPNVKLNNRPGLNAMQVTPSHQLVPIESLTTSPTSSTGSASVLEWNSNSDGELLQLSSPSLASLTAPLSPPPLSPSVIFTLPLADSAIRDDSTQPVGGIAFSSSESTIPDVWTPLFDGLVTPAPTFSRDNTIVIDDDSTTGQDTIRPSQDPEVDKLRDLFDHGFWRTPLSDIDLPQSSDEARSPTPSSEIAHNPFSASMSSTIVLPQLHNTSLSSPGPMKTPTDERTTLTPRILFESPPPSPGPSVPFSLMSTKEPQRSTPVPIPQRSTPISIGEVAQKSTPISVGQGPQRSKSQPIATELISIAEYFRQKAMVSGVTEPVSPGSEIAGIDDITTPPRPPSSNSALSYVMTVPNSPVPPNIPDLRSTSPSISVQSAKDQQNTNHRNKFSVSATLSSPVVEYIDPIWTQLAATPHCEPLLSPTGRTESELDASFVEWLNKHPKQPDSFSFPSSAPRRAIFVTNSGMVKENTPAQTRWQYPVSRGTAWLPPPEREVKTPETPGLDDSPVFSYNRISEPEVEERKPPVNATIPQTLPRSTFSSSSISERDQSYPNIPTWLVNSARVSMSGIGALGNTSTSLRLRPLPPAPKIDVTPQFALRSELDKPQIATDECYALPQPSNWGTQTRNAVSPPPPFSPIPSSNRNRNRNTCPSESTTYSPVSVDVNLQSTVPTAPPPPPPAAPRPPIVEQCTSPHLATCGLYPSSHLHPPPPPVHVPSQPMSQFQYLSNGVNHSPPFYRSPATGSYCQPTYTDSTLPHDRRLPPPSSPEWGRYVYYSNPPLPPPPPAAAAAAAAAGPQNTTRRLRFASSTSSATLPPSGSAAFNFKSGGPPSTSTSTSTSAPHPPAPPPAPATGVIPPYASLGPTFFNSSGFIYQTPAPVIPQVHSTPPSATLPSTVAPPLGNANGQWSTSNWSFPSNRKYWFTDGSVIFRVEDCLYRVHRHFFEKHSDYISRLLTTYGPYDLSSHVFLPDVKKIEFERLLSIFYPTDLRKSDVTTVAGWTSILSLGQKWQMAQITSLAIQRLTPLTTAVEKLAIARKHNFLPNHEWILPSYIELSSRRSPLTLDEAEELDLATVVKIWEVQHSVMLWSCRYGGTCPDVRIVDMVKEKFGYPIPTGYPTPNSTAGWESGPAFFP